MSKNNSVQLYFQSPFVVNVVSKGSLVVSKNKIIDPIIVDVFLKYKENKDIVEFITKSIARFNELKVSLKYPFCSPIKKTRNTQDCPYGCKNMDVKCIDCFDGSHFLPKDNVNSGSDF